MSLAAMFEGPAPPNFCLIIPFLNKLDLRRCTLGCTVMKILCLTVIALAAYAGSVQAQLDGSVLTGINTSGSLRKPCDAAACA